MGNQRTVKFFRSLSLKWFLPTFPFPGEITFVDSKYDPISGESYGIPKKCTTLWQYQSWKGIFLLPNEVLPLTEWPQGHHRNKLDSVGNKPTPPTFIFVWSCQLNQCLGLLCLRQCFVVSNDCHDFKSQPWSSLAAVHKLATGWLWCPGKNENSLKCRLSFVFFTTLKIIQVIFGCFQACCFARMMF